MPQGIWVILTFHFLSMAPRVVVEPEVSERKKSRETWSVAPDPTWTYTKQTVLEWRIPPWLYWLCWLVLVWQITGGFFPVFPITVRLSAASVPAVVPQSAPQQPALAAVELALFPPSTRLSKSSRIWKHHRSHQRVAIKHETSDIFYGFLLSHEINSDLIKNYNKNYHLNDVSLDDMATYKQYICIYVTGDIIGGWDLCHNNISSMQCQSYLANWGVALSDLVWTSPSGTVGGGEPGVLQISLKITKDKPPFPTWM